MWTSDFVILAPGEEAPESSFMVDPQWVEEFSSYLVPELSDTVMIAAHKLYPSGDYKYSPEMQNYNGDYNIVVAKAFRTDEPFVRTLPSGFSWADTWYSDADF